MLNSKNITSLNFAFKSCVYTMFVKGRPMQDALLLVTAALASEDLVKFRQDSVAGTRSASGESGKPAER